MFVLVNGARRTFSAKDGEGRKDFLLASTFAQPKSGNDNRTYGKPFAHTLWKRLLRRLYRLALRCLIISSQPRDTVIFSCRRGGGGGGAGVQSSSGEGGPFSKALERRGGTFL